MARKQEAQEEMFEETTEEITEETTEEITEETETQAAPYDPWKDMRRIFIPKLSRTEQDTLEVGVNNKTYFVPKQKFWEVPMPVWEVINEMLDRRRIMEEEAKRSSGVHEF